MKTKGIILYNGFSLLDNKKIVCIATFNSNNKKTGRMIQTWIFLDNKKSPLENALNGKDISVCGDCPHRPNNGKLGSCYVNLGQAPNQIYKSYLLKKYQKLDPEKHKNLFIGRTIRLGSYGEVVSVPISVWDSIIPLCINHTGYTHQWRNPVFQEYRRYCMASCETVHDVQIAHTMGWRTFRVKLNNQEKLKNEIVCPASEEAGKTRTCETCKACRGNPRLLVGATSVVINVHGLDWKLKKYAQKLNEIEQKQRFSLPLIC